MHYVTRRRLIVAGTTAAVGAAGIALGTDGAGAQADVSTDGLEIQPAEFTPEDSEVFAPWLLLTGEWSYQTEQPPAEWQAYCLVYDGSGNSEAVGMTSGEVSATGANGTYALRGAITAASFYGPDDFAVPDGEESVTRTVPVEAVFVVRDADGGALVQARAGDEAVVTVTATGQTVASLSGSGEIVAQMDSDDPTPQLPEGG